ncbi:hypothetical protein PRIPAC_76539 [Pristionchus pacificus]|uniref:Uncharacterized protein n=1 Tax=Pristionchus pacificus TaxID=54126 RepID=A0A2A6C8Q3_PRIPA|nr:hypothetical protein PRIPAC_76539 [Pristionchus pacificus]|eukprot:PDM74480.1 hypothetical protein PRIPAC_41836 [Pristionchus pacificus]
MDINDPDLLPWCVQYVIQKGFVWPYKHEAANAVICLALMIYLIYDIELRRTYKTNLIPLLFIQIFNSFSQMALYAMPFASCYTDYPWKVIIPIRILNISFTIKPYFILHSLIRDPLRKRFSVTGLAVSIAVPSILVIMPALRFIFDLDFEYTIPALINCFTGIANIAIAIYIVQTDQTDGSLFPLLAAVYEGLYAIPQMLKFSFIFQFNDYDLYNEIEAIDDYSFFLMSIVAALILIWKNRHTIIKPWFSSKSDDAEVFSFDNQNVFV